MITAVLGEPGAGKSAFLAYKIKDTYLRSGRSLLSCSASYIARLNDERGTSFDVPQRPPIYADFDVTFKTGYKKTFSPYKANGFYVGFTNENSPVQFFPPYACIFLDEVSRYYDSRKSSSMPEWVSRFYERHRHFHLNFYLALQRAMLLDKNIREIAHKFILIQELKNTVNAMGVITSNKWTCLEFDGANALNLYIDSHGKEKTYKKTVYTNNGNVFDLFNSYNYAQDFVPPEGSNFSYNEFLSSAEIKKLPESEQNFYKNTEPKGFRGSGKNA